MALSLKGKRKIVVCEQLFYWHIRKGKLTIISEDKKLIASANLSKTINLVSIEKAENRQELVERSINFTFKGEKITPQDIAGLIQQLL